MDLLAVGDLVVKLAPLGLAGGLVLLLFVQLERAGRREVVLDLVLAALLVDVSLFPKFTEDRWLLQPTVLGRSVDLAALLAVLALVSRARRGRRLRVTVAGGLWLVFLAWTGAAGVHGALAGHSSSAVLYQGLLLVHLGVVALVVAGVPLRRLTAPSGLPALAWATAPVALVLGLTTLAGVTVSVPLPGAGDVVVGELGADAATVYASLGVVALLVGLASPPGRRQALVPGLVLLVSPVVPGQRAALLGLLGVLAVVAVGLVLQGTPPALRVLGSEVVLASVLVACVAALGLGVTTLTGTSTGLTAEIRHTLDSTAKQQSSQSRVNQWTKALDLVAEEPVVGNGLGATYVYYEVGGAELVRSDITHDVPLDVALRSGLVGVLLLVGATLATTWEGLTSFTSRRRPLARAVALAGLSVLAGLVAKGAVESVFEKHRLAVLIGLGVGLVAAAGRPDGDPLDELDDDPLDDPLDEVVDGALDDPADPALDRARAAAARGPAAEVDRSWVSAVLAVPDRP